MIYISLLENIILPIFITIFYTGFIVIITLIIYRIRKLSLYQQRIDKYTKFTLNDNNYSLTKSINNLLTVILKRLQSLLLKTNVIDTNLITKNNKKLQTLGKSHPYATTILIILQSLVALLLGIIAIIMNQLVFANYLGINQPLLLFLIGLFMGLRLFNYYLNILIHKYRNNIKRNIADALEILIICIDSGYNNQEAIHKVALEFADIYPEIANEFKITYNELTMLPSRLLAWKNFAHRTELSEIRSVATIFQQNDKYGTSVVSALRNQIRMLRNHSILSAEEQAAKIPVLLAIPLTIFFLPIIFIIILSPAILKILTLL